MKSSKTQEIEYDFTLLLDGINTIDTAVEDAIYEAGCDDATISARGGRVFLAFARSAPSLRDAIESAVRDVERSSISASAIRVDVDDLVESQEIDAINSVLRLKHEQRYEAAEK